MIRRSLAVLATVFALSATASAQAPSYDGTYFVPGLNDGPSRFYQTVPALQARGLDLKAWWWVGLSTTETLATQASELSSLRNGNLLVSDSTILVGHSMGGLTSRRSYLRLSPLLYGSLLAVGACEGCREPTGLEGRHAPRECWYAADTGFARSIPVIVGANVVHATGSNTIVGRDSATGARRWESAILPRASRGYALVAGGGGVVVVLHNATAAGLEGNSGAVLWTYTTPTDQGQAGTVARNTPAADSAYAYVPAREASVSAVDLRTGVARWIWRTPDTASTRAGAVGVAIAGDTVYATVWKWITPTGTVTEQWLVALDRRSGVELWREVFTEPLQFVHVFNAPVVSGRVVAFSLLNGQVFALDRFTRERLWETADRVGYEAVVHPPVVSGDTIFIPESDRIVTARDIADGHLFWERRIHWAYGQLALAGPRLYMAAGPYLTALDRETGKVLWAGTIPTKPGVRPEMRSVAAMLGSAGGRLFISAVGGTFCLRE